MSRAAALLLGLALLASGCERPAPARHETAQAQAPDVGPILPAEAPELLSKPGELVIGGTQAHQADFTHSVYTHADPAQCPFMVAEESPILPKGPIARNSAWWGTNGTHTVIEVASVYSRGFDAAAALAEARQRLAACYGKRVDAFTDRGPGEPGMFQQGPEAGTANAQLWSWGRANVWTCAYGLVAKYNAVVLAAACEQRGDFDLRALVLAKERRMDQLAHPQV
ncbi:sensor domain-containing protein [Segniliparus rugosus]|uniref:Uncharacterized protein n=1 Tax=Segniliparus rugosus (strain ATCC BAA-974 / DSM 45345 / CCUG 50838 / CIP 108380 / JCM 13579 / CDC 945) TaxID=679197 RepID=E5XR29_SEGRC|nr:sensor domain-containing protein [Segniliparus rugosus]EFV13182.1 hypothetical protein HMPREF9336_01951 [Segniliparus rugosus ATCC BAA-974]